MFPGKDASQTVDVFDRERKPAPVRPREFERVDGQRFTYVTQSLDALVRTTGSARANAGLKSVLGRKTGAETARNGNSFPAIIERMIAGAKEGREFAIKANALKTAGRGAGGALDAPGDADTLIKHGPDKKSGILDQSKNLKNSRQKGVFAQRDDESDSLAGMAAMAAALQTQDATIAARKKGEAQAVSEEGSGTVGSSKKNARSVRGEHARDSAENSGLDSLLASYGKGSERVNAGNQNGKDAFQSQKADRKDRKAVIGVRDDRTKEDLETLGDTSQVKAMPIEGENVSDMAISFRGAENGSGAKADSSRILAEKRDVDGQNFASMLSQELKNNAADFVKTGQIVLKDNNAGLIRLTLNPESLGNVKISLELSGDKKITGKIVVSSEEAYEAFNENLEGLSQAFVDGGFQSAGFDLSWSGQGSEAANREAEAAVRAPFYASSVPDVMSAAERADNRNGGWRYGDSSAINVFA